MPTGVEMKSFETGSGVSKEVSAKIAVLGFACSLMVVFIHTDKPPIELSVASAALLLLLCIRKVALRNLHPESVALELADEVQKLRTSRLNRLAGVLRKLTAAFGRGGGR